AEFLAARAGGSVSEARRQLETCQRLKGAAATADKLRDGELSMAQTEAIADAVNADPTAEPKLLAMAKTSSLSELRDECARVKAAADPDPNGTRLRIHKGRFLRTYRDAEGAVNGRFRGPADACAKLLAALNPLIDQQYKVARA